METILEAAGRYVPGLNLVLAWAWVAAGILSGMWMGLRFQREDWLGGYGSARRRLYRLGHIAFMGTALLNGLFYVSATLPGVEGPGVWLAGCGFLLGAMTMPFCCLAMAHVPRAQALFALPVTCFLAGTVVMIIKLGEVLLRPSVAS